MFVRFICFLNISLKTNLLEIIFYLITCRTILVYIDLQRFSNSTPRVLIKLQRYLFIIELLDFNNINFHKLFSVFYYVKSIYLSGLEDLTKSRLSTAVYTVLKGRFPALPQHWFQFSIKVTYRKPWCIFVCIIRKYILDLIPIFIFVERNFDRSTFTRCSVYKNASLVFAYFLEECFFFSYPKGSFRPLQRLCKKVAQVSAETQPLLRSIKKGLY